jgi:hypothetical protein
MDAAALPLLIGLVIVALAFDFLNGMNDAANSIATIVSTRVLRPQYAVAGCVFNFIAFLFFGLHVAETVGRGIVEADVVNEHVIFRCARGRDRVANPNAAARDSVLEFARIDHAVWSVPAYQGWVQCGRVGRRGRPPWQFSCRRA